MLLTLAALLYYSYHNSILPHTANMKVVTTIYNNHHLFGVKKLSPPTSPQWKFFGNSSMARKGRGETTCSGFLCPGKTLNSFIYFLSAAAAKPRHIKAPRMRQEEVVLILQRYLPAVKKGNIEVKGFCTIIRCN